MRFIAVLLACLALTGALFAEENATLNATANVTQNETIAQTANTAGGFALDKLLNLSWGDGLAGWLNATLNTTFFTGSFVAALVPLISIAMIFWKWNAIMGFFQTAGQVVLVLVAGYVVLKALGVL